MPVQETVPAFFLNMNRLAGKGLAARFPGRGEKFPDRRAEGGSVVSGPAAGYSAGESDKVPVGGGCVQGRFFGRCLSDGLPSGSRFWKLRLSGCGCFGQTIFLNLLLGIASKGRPGRSTRLRILLKRRVARVKTRGLLLSAKRKANVCRLRRVGKFPPRRRLRDAGFIRRPHLNVSGEIDKV